MCVCVIALLLLKYGFNEKKKQMCAPQPKRMFVVFIERYVSRTETCLVIIGVSIFARYSRVYKTLATGRR